MTNTDNSLKLVLSFKLSFKNWHFYINISKPEAIFTKLDFLAWEASLLGPGKPFHPSIMYHTNLLYSFVSYKENKVLWICPQQFSANI